VASRPIRGAALWTSIGFVCGAIFWQAVGVWTLMSEVMLDGGAAAAQQADANEQQLETGSLPTIYHIDPQRCVSLELDRFANRTTQRPCPNEGLALRLESGETREDMTILADGSAR